MCETERRRDMHCTGRIGKKAARRSPLFLYTHTHYCVPVTTGEMRKKKELMDWERGLFKK